MEPPLFRPSPGIDAPASRAVLVVDDSARRVAAAVALLEALNGRPAAALHVCCSSARAAERVSAALRRAVRQPARRARQARAEPGLVVGSHRVHVLGNRRTRPEQDADCALEAADWLFGLVRDLHQHEHGIDAVAGPHGPFRAVLLRGAVETAGTGDDRLFLLRRKRGRIAGSRHGRGRADTCTLLLVRHVPPARRDHERADERYSDLVARRVNEWRLGTSADPLVIDAVHRVARIGTVEVSLSPDQTFWYAAFGLAPGRIFPHRAFGGALRLDQQGTPEIQASEASAEGPVLHEWLRHFRKVFDRVQPRKGYRFGHMLRNACGVADPQLGATLSRLGGALHDALGDAAERYAIRARPGHGYSLNLPADLVIVHLPPSNGERRLA